MSNPIPAHPEEGLSSPKGVSKAYLEGPSFETPVRQAHRLLRMSGGGVPEQSA